ncbi:hypothetical protein AAA88_004613 [Salmonella enterica subsp. diarizonae]|nr:hypothetical protein [Salmonella enterica subsp. diarizonae]
MLTRVKYPTLASTCLTESHTALRTKNIADWIVASSRGGGQGERNQPVRELLADFTPLWHFIYRMCLMNKLRCWPVFLYTVSADRGTIIHG